MGKKKGERFLMYFDVVFHQVFVRFFSDVKVLLAGVPPRGGASRKSEARKGTLRGFVEQFGAGTRARG